MGPSSRVGKEGQLLDQRMQVADLNLFSTLVFVNMLFDAGRALLAKSRDLLPVLRDKWGVAMQVG